MFKWTDFWLGSSDEVAYSQGCDAMAAELAQYYHISVVSMRNAIWHEAHTPIGHPLRWQSWSQEGGRHLNLMRGDRLAAEQVYHWLRRATSIEAPDGAPDVARAGWLSECPINPRYGSWRSAGAQCFSFADAFKGLIEAPHVRVPPTASALWRFEKEVQYGGGKKSKEKPGYVASARGATLHVDTLHTGQHLVSVGFLRTYSSRAVAVLGCVAPCRCAADDAAATNLSVATRVRASTLQLSPQLMVSSPPPATCTLELRLLTDGQPFKFIALQVQADEAVGRHRVGFTRWCQSSPDGVTRWCGHQRAVSPMPQESPAPDG